MGNLSFGLWSVPVEACGVVSWSGHRADGEGDLRLSRNAELLIFWAIIKTFQPRLAGCVNTASLAPT